ncbi:MAG TPA: O-antigen ligase family protein [Pirellulales bacterium]|nr:O-antigen ligase family protein [Pirellulales bacterium]
MDFLTIVAACAALVWIGWFVLRGSLVGGCLAVMIVSACFGYQFWHADGGLPLSADRGLIGLMAIAYIVHRRWGFNDPKPTGRADWVLLALLVMLGISTFTHNWKGSATSTPAAHWIFYWLMPAMIYWIVRQSPLDDRTVRRAWGALALFGVYLTFTALAESTGQWWAVFPSYICSPTTEFFGRARGPFLNPAEMGIYLMAGLLAALTFWSVLGRLGQLILLAFTALTLAAVYATLTRCSWIGGGLGLAVFIGFSVPRSWRRLFLCLSAMGAITLFAAKWDSMWNIKRDVNLDAAASEESAELRPILAEVAYQMFLDRPLWGCGFGQYDREKLPYLADRSNSSLPLEKVIPYVQHNAFLALLVETGLVGMCLFVLLLLLWLHSAWKIYRDPRTSAAVRQSGIMFMALVAAYLPTALFHDTNIMDGANLLMFLAAAIVSGLAANAVPINTKKENSSLHQRKPVPVLAAQSL